MKSHFTLTWVLIAALAASCSKPAQQPVQRTSAEEGRRVYEVRGIVRGALADNHSVTIEHEDIPGFMPSMTMPFEFKDRREIAGVNPGDAVRFQLIVTDRDSWIEHVQKTDPSSVRLPKTAEENATGAGAERLKEGDALPGFKLVDQNGRTLTRESFTDKTLLFTFIFTRCPLPNFCPLMSRNFAELQRAIEADPALNGRVQLVSISFDPDHDTPEVLAKYAAAFTRHGDSWRFATGSRAEIDKLTREFSVYVQAENGTISHGLCTAMIASDGTIRKIWRGNGWEVSEALDALRIAAVAR